jgi:2-polyprenyl-6-methoxyphenol hydroxylase-like FAD-dependent oxidoreductase
MTKRAIIIGAGPAGIATAAFLAEDGWVCDVYEAGTEEIATQASDEYMDRAYGLSLQDRSINVMERIHATEDVLRAGAYWRKGSVFHLPHVQRPMFRQENFKTLSCLRTELVCGLLRTVRRKWKHQVRFHWECPVVQLCLNKEGTNVMVLIGNKKLNEASAAQSADLIVCADGANSNIGRRDLAILDPTFHFKTTPSGLVGKSILFDKDEEWTPDPDSLHFIHGKSGILLLGRDNGPRPSFRPGISSILIYPQSSELFGQNATAHDMLSLLQDTFTEVQLPVHKVISKEGLQRSAESREHIYPGTCSCSHYNYRNFVLIGDAAHCSQINAAQGVNTALEDAFLLTNLLKDQTGSHNNVDQALENFTRSRKPDMDALQRMMRHPFFATMKSTWRSQTIEKLRWTKAPCLRSLNEQILLNELSFSQCEKNMLLQYHLPTLIAVLSLGLSSRIIPIGVRHLIKLFFVVVKALRT